MAKGDFSTTGLLGGMRLAEQDIQRNLQFDMDLQRSQQELFAKSLEIQTYLDDEEKRRVERKRDVLVAEADIRLAPEREVEELDKLRRGKTQRAQEEVKRGLDITATRQDIRAAELEHEETIADKPVKAAQRRRDIAQAQAEEGLMPAKTEAERIRIEAETEKTQMEQAARRMEERARPLFGLTAENYEERYDLISDETKQELGLTGKWVNDGGRIVPYRQMARDNLAHIREGDLQSQKLRNASPAAQKGTLKSHGTQDLKDTHLVAEKTETYGNLAGGHKGNYLVGVTSIASHLYSEAYIRNKNNPNTTPPPSPKSFYVKELMNLADQFVSGPTMYGLGDVLNRRTFDEDAFYEAAAETYGYRAPRGIYRDLGINIEEITGEELPEEAAPAAPQVAPIPAQAQSVVDQFRKEKGFGGDVTDKQIFDSIVRSGYLNEQGEVIGKSVPEKATKPQRKRGRTAARIEELEGPPEPTRKAGRGQARDLPIEIEKRSRERRKRLLEQ